MVRTLVAMVLLSLASALPAPAQAGRLFSKTYEFKAATILEVGADIERGLRLDSVRFLVPASGDGTVTRAGETVQVEVALSNTGSESRRIAIALALFDDQGRLLGVTSGGDKLFPLKGGRQATYLLTFSHVNAEAPRATRFQISVETKS
jgi:hypothetical protein